MVEIQDNYLVVFISLIFVPLFIFLVKMIIEQGKNAARLDQYDEHIRETKGHHTTIELIRQRLENLENDIKYLFRIVKTDRDRDRRYGRGGKGGDQDGTYYPDGDIADHGAE